MGDKVAHNTTMKILRDLRTRRLHEEHRLRVHSLSIHDKLTTLSREKSRLEEQQRSDEKRIERNRQLIEELQQHVLQLQIRKAQFECLDLDVEIDEVAATSCAPRPTSTRTL